MQRQSAKRQAILDCVKNLNTHPTAEQIYTLLKPLFPDLSLATVYRNLNQLEASGDLRSVGTVSGKERYDADMTVHSHAVCLKCGKIIDVRDIAIPQEMIEAAQNATGYSIFCSDLHFTGLCDDCRKESEKNG